MAKAKSIFVCQQCGAQRPRWEGRCTDCGAWNSFAEEKPMTTERANPRRGWSIGQVGAAESQRIWTLAQTIKDTSARSPRQSTGLGELDRVLGGGLVKGTYVLIGGDPGIGKSTLVLQMAGGLAKANQKVLYFSAEESVEQTGLRAQRLGIHHELVEIASESRLESIAEFAKARRPDVLIIDSIQTVYTEDVASAPGSVSQVRECAARLLAFAKNEGIAVFLIGHVTKEGHLAGPRVLEHMVDTVLSFEGDPHHQYRLLRALKNRFGATNELGVFQMSGLGLREITNPSEMFLAEREEARLGSVVFAAVEGSRPLLCEIQALTNYTPMTMPRRTSLGIDTNRIHMLLAVLEKQARVELHQREVYINVVGGLRLEEPAADLAVAAAILSTERQFLLPAHACFFGEVGLTGEVRAAAFAAERIRESVKLGYNKIYLPKANERHVNEILQSTKSDKIDLVYIKSVQELSRALAGTTKAIKTPPAKSADLTT